MLLNNYKPSPEGVRREHKIYVKMNIKIANLFELNHKYRWVTVSNYDNWTNIKISAKSEKSNGTQEFANRFVDHIVYDCEDKSTEHALESLISEIRLLTLHHEFINTLCHPDIHIDNSSKKLYWVYVENCSHILNIGVKSDSAKPKDMYLGNCFDSRAEAEVFREELIAIFNKYGITITRI